MQEKYIMSIDQGTTGTTVSILNRAGSPVAKINQEYRQIFPKPGWVEHDPQDIWNSVTYGITQSLKQAEVSAQQIAAIGITNQRETIVVWDRATHKPIYNAIVWQCRRTSDFCQGLRKKGLEKLIQKKTGLVIDPYFSASKLRWILKSEKDAEQKAKNGDLAMGTIDCFLIWKLTNGLSHKTDLSNASRTMLLNIHTGKWDPELLKIFSIPEKILPEVSDSCGVFGVTKGLGVLPDGIPISGVAGDQQAALFGQTCFEAGSVKCTFGTGSFLLLNTGSKPIKSNAKLLTTIAWKLPGKPIQYALEGSVFICGAAVQWLRDGLGIIKESSEMENLANQVADSGGVVFVPALTGLGAPYWWSDARGMISGITRGTTRAHLARATLEAMALQNMDLLSAMEKDLGKKLKMVRVDGGAAINNLLMRMQADYSGLKIVRPRQIETTSIGAAYLAGLGIGYWKSLEELKEIWKVDQEFLPQMTKQQKKNQISKWHSEIKKLKA